MKLLKKNRNENFVKIEVESEDDLWQLKDVIKPQDRVKMKTQRTKLDGREKKTCTLKLKVEKMEYQNERLRVTGEIEEGAEDIELGYHTFNIEPGKRFTLYKENFSDQEWGRLEEAQDKEPYKVLFCLLQKGEADFFLVEESGIKDLSQVNQNIPGKLYDDQKSGEDFFSKVKNYLERTAEDVDKIILGGPGFAKERLNNLLSNKTSEKIMVQDTSVIGETGLHEAIKRGALDKVVKDSRISKESGSMDEFFQELREDGNVTYGEPVLDYAELGAVKKLLITPKMKREERKLVQDVEQNGGEVQVVHTDHEKGERLSNLGGIAALLRYDPGD